MIGGFVSCLISGGWLGPVSAFTGGKCLCGAVRSMGGSKGRSNLMK